MVLQACSNAVTNISAVVPLTTLGVMYLSDNPIVDSASLDPLIGHGVDVLFEDPDA